MIMLADQSGILLFLRGVTLWRERATAQRQFRSVLERAIDDLPDAFRIVFVMRDIEEASTEETASVLGIRPQTVKTKLHRARRRYARSWRANRIDQSSRLAAPKSISA